MADGALENLTEAAGEKIGPLPAWGWGLIVAGVALVAWFLWGRGAAASTASPAAATSSSSDSSYTGDGIPNDTSSVSDGSSSSDSSSVDTSSSDTSSGGFSFSNTAWLARGMAQVSLEFGASPSDVYTALYLGLTGGTMTTSQKKFWDRALSDLGAPPEGTEGVINVVPDPVASNPTSSTTPTPTGTTTTPAPKPTTTTTTTPKPTPAPSTSITSIAIGKTYKLEKAHRGYSTAAEANSASQSKYAKMLEPGSYVVVGRQKMSSGYVVRLLKGVTALWINV